MNNIYCGFFVGMKPRKSSELVLATKRVNSETEFVILGSHGIWEVRYELPRTFKSSALKHPDS